MFSSNDPMKLVGIYRSPYVRRVAAAMISRAGVPGSQTVLEDLGVDGHPPATAPRLLGESGK